MSSGWPGFKSTLRVNTTRWTPRRDTNIAKYTFSSLVSSLRTAEKNGEVTEPSIVRVIDHVIASCRPTLTIPPNLISMHMSYRRPYEFELKFTSHSTQNRSFLLPNNRPTSTTSFGDVLPSQSVRVVLKKLDLTQQKQTLTRNTKILEHKINTRSKARLGRLVRISGLKTEQALYYSFWGPHGAVTPYQWPTDVQPSIGLKPWELCTARTRLVHIIILFLTAHKHIIGNLNVGQCPTWWSPCQT